MAKASMALAELVEKAADTDVLRQMIQYVAQRLMDLDVEGLCRAGYGERSPERTNSHNGYRDRVWDTRTGTVELKIPKVRAGSYLPAFLEPRRTAEKALAAMIQEAYIQGVSTRSVDELVRTLGMSGISKSQVSRLCSEIDERVGAFVNRPLEGTATVERTATVEAPVPAPRPNPRAHSPRRRGARISRAGTPPRAGRGAARRSSPAPPARWEGCWWDSESTNTDTSNRGRRTPWPASRAPRGGGAASGPR